MTLAARSAAGQTPPAPPCQPYRFGPTWIASCAAAASSSRTAFSFQAASRPAYASSDVPPVIKQCRSRTVP
eukprot:4997182-Prymnesium_polylepis.1